MRSPFTPKTLAFLRSLTRHNDREWFRARKTDYEQHVHAPMVEVIGRLADDFRVFVPELVADPKVSLFRILRFKQFLGFREYDAAFATSPAFYPELLKVFGALVPLVRFLNAPLQAMPPRTPALTDLRRRDSRRG